MPFQWIFLFTQKTNVNNYLLNMESLNIRSLPNMFWYCTCQHTCISPTSSLSTSVVPKVGCAAPVVWWDYLGCATRQGEVGGHWKWAPLSALFTYLWLK
jgi:hypothetical protein